MEEKMHFSGEKHLHRGFLEQRRYILSEKSICTVAFWNSEDTFCRRKVSAQRLLVEAKMHFVGGKHLHRGILWKRRCIFPERSICTEAFWSSEDTFFWRKASAKGSEEQMKIHPPGRKHLQAMEKAG